jgi:hypothetical protein
MAEIFSYTESYNQPLKSWDVRKVINMTHMFYHAESFEEYVCSWYNLQFQETPIAIDMFYGSNCGNKSDPNFSSKASFCGTYENPKCQVSRMKKNPFLF